jgi:hypothetical protein
MKRQNFSLPEETRAQLDALAALYGGNASEVVRAAIAALHARNFVGREPPYVKGWDEFVLAKDTPCADTGTIMLAGTKAWREVWSDGRVGDVYSRASLEADGIL